jgi:hypothetical protein
MRIARLRRLRDLSQLTGFIYTRWKWKRFNVFVAKNKKYIDINNMCMWETSVTWEVLTDEQYNMGVFATK